MAKIKVGQIGVEHPHAAGKMQALRDSPEFEVVGVVEPNKVLQQRAAASATYQDLPWMTQEELLNRADVQAVAVETHLSQSLEVAEACIAAGKHIHLDKPAGISLPHFQKILDAAASQHLLVQMGYMYRYNPGVVLMRELMDEGALGEPFAVHGVIGKLMNAASRKTIEQQPGGIMFELGCHMLDLVIHILGPPQELTAINLHSSPIEDQLVDNMLAVLEYENASATVQSSCNEVDGFARRQLTVCGTEGTLEIRPMGNPAVRLALNKPFNKFPKGTQTVELPKYVRYVDDFMDMAKIIRNEKESDFSYAHDLLVQRTLLQISGMSTA